jgi:hypothetical protein
VILSDREVAMLRVLADARDPIFAARAGALAFGEQPNPGSGATRTLRALERKLLASGRYEISRVFGKDTAMRWTITEKGREALSRYAFGE